MTCHLTLWWSLLGPRASLRISNGIWKISGAHSSPEDNSDVRVKDAVLTLTDKGKKDLNWFLTKCPFPLSSDVKDSCLCGFKMSHCLRCKSDWESSTGQHCWANLLREVINALGRIIRRGDVLYGTNKSISPQFWLNQEWEWNSTGPFLSSQTSLTHAASGGAGSVGRQQLSPHGPEEDWRMEVLFTQRPREPGQHLMLHLWPCHSISNVFWCLEPLY